ncbi:MAG: hypothetical protein ACREPX_02565 [Rhodanobacteraceae bacterium]
MASKSRSASRAPRTRAKKPLQSAIAEPFQVIGASKVHAGDATAHVPMLVLRGEWLKACGFPIGSAAYLTTDARGELALHRLGLSLPRRVRIVAAKR